MIYLDHNATTPLAPEALQAMLPFLQTHHGNPSSIHRAGRETRAAIDNARDHIAQILGAKPHEIIFTSGGTESNNLALLGLARAHTARGKHLLTCATEHHAVLHPLQSLAAHEGFDLEVLPVEPDGRISPERLAQAITAGTSLVSIMTANNETGVQQDTATLSALCRERGILFHTDAIQSFGKQPLPALSTSHFDAVSLAAHKFYGPKGIGLLWLRAGLPIHRTAHGGSHEGERRAGTENTAAIVGMARAAEISIQNITSENARLIKLREHLWRIIRTSFPSAIRNGTPDHCLANTLNISFPGLDGESLLINLDLLGIAASSGSACMVGSIQPSHVLLAMGVPPEIAQATVRFSLGKSTDDNELQTLETHLATISHRLCS